MGDIIRYKPILNLLIIVVVLGGSSMSFSANNLPRLGKREILQRCYTQLTGLRLSSGSSLWSRVKNEKASSICVELLNRVSFTTEGILTESGNLVHRQILKQFLDFHRTWFDQQWAFINSFPDEYWGGVDIYDPQEPALFLTRNLVASESYSRVLSGYETAVALRDGSALRSQLPAAANGFLRPSRNTYHNFEGPLLNSNAVTYSTKIFSTAPAPRGLMHQ